MRHEKVVGGEEEEEEEDDDDDEEEKFPFPPPNSLDDNEEDVELVADDTGDEKRGRDKPEIIVGSYKSNPESAISFSESEK